MAPHRTVGPRGALSNEDGPFERKLQHDRVARSKKSHDGHLRDGTEVRADVNVRKIARFVPRSCPQKDAAEEAVVMRRRNELERKARLLALEPRALALEQQLNLYRPRAFVRALVVLQVLEGSGELRVGVRTCGVVCQARSGPASTFLSQSAVSDRAVAPPDSRGECEAPSRLRRSTSFSRFALAMRSFANLACFCQSPSSSTIKVPAIFSCSSVCTKNMA